MKKAFEDVRTEVSNLNSFVQERVTGMKILQLFTREDTERTEDEKKVEPLYWPESSPIPTKLDIEITTMDKRKKATLANAVKRGCIAKLK